MAKRGRKEKDNWKKKRRQEYLEKKEFRYYIFCEGQATEPKYFQGFKRYIEDNPIYRDMVLIEIEGCQAETMRVIGKAEEYVRENKITKGQIWCVYDKDSFPSSDVNGVVQRAEVLNQKNPDLQYHAAWSNECIEFRSYGVDVREYQGDYGEAVKHGRELSNQNPNSYFVDDENSKNLFLGYSVAGKRLQKQLDEMKIKVDKDHPLFVYIPCGVGGAPGGITFGLKEVYGDFVHCFFVEPVQAPCMLLGMTTGLGSRISVQDIGLSGVTQADGLAVGRPSAFVGMVMKPMLSGAMTVRDARLYGYMKALKETEQIFLEPSACAAFQGVVAMGKKEKMQEYLKNNELEEKMQNATHIIWATGGSLVPEEIRKEYMKTAIDIEERIS